MHPSHRNTHRIACAVSAFAVTAAGLAANAGTAWAIEGGTPAHQGDQPWYAGILMSGDGSPLGRLVCGGTLIAPARVLTAAHCVDGSAPGDLTVRLDADLLGAPGPEIPIQRIAIHPGYEIADAPDGIRRVHNDVAIVELSESVGGQVLPIATSTPPTGTPVTALGHGNTGPHADKSDPLLRADMTTLPAAECGAAMRGHYEFEDDQQLCVGPVASAAVKPCSGDSGGPLVTGAGPSARLAGVASYLDRQASCDDPTARLVAYADAAEFRDWALSPTPTWAPRPLGDVVLEGNPHPGGTLTCRAPRWDGNPDTVDYQWLVTRIDEQGRAVDVPVPDAAAESEFTVPAHAVDHTVACIVTARNEGGTAGAGDSVRIGTAPTYSDR